ncbi:MAG: hypothetical protein ACE37B_10680 [Ilumatobacter sp.]|uniref:hypothetical protein n=1 Tax=Ilumatobacter sp. TaxID=1967498 RepID=UPI00391DDA82
MDVVVRTPHGDADIEIVSAPPTVTLGDLLAAVNGQAAPPIARVDGRIVSTVQPLVEAGLAIGSVIDARSIDPAASPVAPSAAATAPAPPAPAINLLQLTGRGAGTIRRLDRGRFRIGPGRRLNSIEMDDAAVESSAFEVTVDSRGTVEVSPGPRIGGALGVFTPTLDGSLFDRPLRWTDGRLSVGGRLFAIEAPAIEPPRRQLPEPDASGAIGFERRPWNATAEHLPVVTARRRAHTYEHGLWTRRSGDPGAMTLPFGVLPDDRSVATIDLDRARGVAIVGTDRFGAALARTLLVEAVTAMGPADLRLAIASTPDRLGQWDWAKWLPHVRKSGDPTAAALLLADDHDLATWAAGITSAVAGDDHPTPPSGIVRANPPTVTGAAPRADWLPPQPVAPTARPPVLLVLDDISLWNRRDSPLRSLLVDPPPHLRILAMCGGLHEAPGLCSVLIEERLPEELFAAAEAPSGNTALFGSLATLHDRLASPPSVTEDIRPALVETHVALEIATALAPLDDLDVERPGPVPTGLAPPSLSELIDIQMATARQPNHDQSGLTVTVGLVDLPDGDRRDGTPIERRPVRVDLAASRVTLVASDDAELIDTLLAAIVLGATATRRTDQLAVLTVGRHRPAWHAEIPHIAGHVDRAAADDPARLVHRVAHVLTSQPGLEVLVVIEDAFVAGQPVHGRPVSAPVDLLTGLLELADSLSRVHVVMTSTEDVASIPESIRNRCGIELAVGQHAGSPRGVVSSTETAVHFIGPTTLGAAISGPPTLGTTIPRTLAIRANVHGRAMTPLERRVNRAASVPTASLPDPATIEIAQRVGAATASNADGSNGVDGVDGGLLPPPLPTSVSHLSLLAQHPGDGVPIGLLDRPERAMTEAYWWQPGRDGTLLAIGSPRSGMTQLADLLATGIAARYSADDLAVYAIEPLPQRRRAFAAMPHCVDVVTTDDPHGVRRIVATVAELVERRRSTSTSPQRDPAIVLFVGDLARLVRWLSGDGVGDILETLASIGSDGADVDVNLVAVTNRVDDLGPIVRSAGDRLIGSVADPNDRARLGIPAPGPADRHPGRCWSVTADRRVQLAIPPDSVEHEIARLASESSSPASTTPPTPKGSTR